MSWERTTEFGMLPEERTRSCRVGCHNDIKPITLLVELRREREYREKFCGPFSTTDMEDFNVPGVVYYQVEY